MPVRWDCVGEGLNAPPTPSRLLKVKKSKWKSGHIVLATIRYCPWRSQHLTLHERSKTIVILELVGCGQWCRRPSSAQFPTPVSWTWTERHRRQAKIARPAASRVERQRGKAVGVSRPGWPPAGRMRVGLTGGGRGRGGAVWSQQTG